MNMYFIMLVFFLHWVFDFLFQSDKMAKEKSSSMTVLIRHSFVYSLLSLSCFLPLQTTLIFLAYLFATHFIIDGITSRITSKLWKANDMHWFFVMVGFDQLLHALVILLFLSQIT